MAARSKGKPGTSPPVRWLFGPVPDLLFGCGLAYLAVFVALAVAGPGVTLWLPASILPLLSVVAGGPHYGATLLRAYERKEDRVKYRNVTLVATLGLALAFLLSLRFYLLGTLLVTLYLLWSPWHYSGQNYGLMMMFLGRRGISTPADPQALDPGLVRAVVPARHRAAERGESVGELRTRCPGGLERADPAALHPAVAGHSDADPVGPVLCVGGGVSRLRWGQPVSPCSGADPFATCCPPSPSC